MADFDLTQSGQEIQDILDGAAMQTDLTAEIERAEQAEQQLQGNIDIEETRAKAAEKQNADDIDVIEGKIPAAASSENKLADKAFVNSSIATATATYRGAYNLVSDLHLTTDATEQQIAAALAGAISTADNNDYCFVQIPTADATPTQIAAIERYKFNGTAWAYEYTLNNSGFTADQWAAINSGITSGLVAKLAELPTNDELTLLLGGKQDVLTFDNAPTEGSNNPVKSGGVKSAIDSEKERAQGAEQANAGNIAQVIAMIPAAASSENQLADKNFVNSSIATNTATYRGAYNEVSDLSLTVDATHEQIAAALAGAISTADNNDYCFVQVPTADATPTQIAAIERYKFNGTAWAYEYTLNNSGFTADQWAAINSGITSGLVAKLAALPTNDDLVAALAGKQPMLTFDNVPTENSTNPVKSGGVYAAIAEEAGTRAAAIAAIVALIPSAASALNQLADKAFVNSSISTATAVFKGTFNVVADLELNYNASQAQIALMLGSKIASADNNDYCFVQIPTSNETPLEIARTDRYKYNGTAWAYEYTLNNSGFTAAQWAAINSGITSLLKDKLIDLPTATELATQLAAKQNTLTFDSTPTEGSTNPVTSGGIHTAINVEKERAEAAEEAIDTNKADKATTLAGYGITDAYNKTEVNNLVSTPNQNYVTVATYASLPASGSTDTIYRVSCYDGANNQVDDTVYSEYAWDGTQYIFLDVKSQIDEVFDITVYNSNTKYADLAAALGVDGANIPATLRRGGMSVKFVQSSDNKYVQYFLTKDEWSATARDWEKVNLGKEVILLDQDLYSNIISGGKKLFGPWENGGINYISGVFTDQKYRIRTGVKVLFKEDVTIKVLDGFIFFRVNYENESDITPVSFNAIYSLNTAVLPKNTWMNFVIQRNDPENPSEIADIQEFLSKVIVDSQIQQNTDAIVALSTNLNDLNDKIKNTDKKVDVINSYENDSVHIFDGKNVITGIFELGAINPSTGDYIDNSRIRSKNKVFYSQDTIISSLQGFKFSVFYYENEVDTIPSEYVDVLPTREYRIPKNRLFRVAIYRVLEVSETADIQYFRQQVLVQNSISTTNKEFVDLMKDNLQYINPRKNLFNKLFVTSGALLGLPSGGYNIIDDANGRIVIIPLTDFGDWSQTYNQESIPGGAFLKISGLKQCLYGHRATLLDENFENIGKDALTNSYWNWTSDDYVINLVNAGRWLAKYIAIKLFDGGDFGNQNPANGYVWSQAEIDAHFPNWDIVININFKNDINEKERKVSELGLSENWWNDSKKYCDQKFGNPYYDKLYNLAHLAYNQNFNFLLASDSHIHTNGASRRNVVDMVDFGSTELMAQKLDCIIHNGDMINGNPMYMTTKQAAINTLKDYYYIVKESGVDYIQCIGNHDKGQDSGLNYDVALTNQESANLLKEYTKHSDNTLYQYYDYVDKKIRIIKIDAFDYPLEDDGNGKVKYNLASYECYISQTQFQWIVSTLLSTPNGYSVIFVGHIYPLHTLITPITELLYGLKHKTSGTVSIDLSEQSPVPPSPTFSVSYDFTGANDVNIVGVFGGHDHIDSLVNTTEIGDIPVNTHGINVFGIRCQMMANNGWNTTHDRFPYTETQNCFNMISIDTKTKKLYILRYGVNDDLYGSDVFDIM